MKILIKSVKIVLPQSKFHRKKVDVLIENGSISKIAASIETKADQVIKDKNLHLSEAWFDSSVSFGEPGFEERETISNGLEVAAKSGFTSLALNPNTLPVIDTNSAVAYLKGKTTNSLVKLYPIGALTKNSEGQHLAEIYDMQQAGAVAFGDYKIPVENANLMKIALQYAQNFEGLIISYPQDNKIVGNGQVNEDLNSTKLGLKGMPALAEELQIARDLFLLEYTGGKLHIPTISTEKSVRLIREAKKKGLDVSCSVAIRNLLFTDENLDSFDSNYKVLPPLRTKSDIRALIKGLKDGTIDMVTSDHCPIDIEHKKMEFENALYGSLGLESAFGALRTIFDLDECIQFLTAGKKRFSIPIFEFAEGNHADFTLFIPDEKYQLNEKNLFSTSKNSIFLGYELQGKVYGSFSKNKFVVNQ
ncbi:MAG TPA: dihydroorotase [Flavobacteriaceae bacterium]|nr:dihydroorotase [Flavobacteriaceae bacterium]